MDAIEIDNLLTFLRKYWLAFILALLGLIFFIYGLISLLGTSKNPGEIKFETNATASGSSNSASANLIAVDIEGEVVKTGVYKLKEGSIVQDALVISGGMTALADRDFVAKNLNLALKLTDGQKIYIPKQGENAQIANSPDQATNVASQITLINVNSASADVLDGLPGIGPVTAGKIITNRPYATINSLLDKKVISQKVFDQIKDKIIVQ